MWNVGWRGGWIEERRASLREASGDGEGHWIYTGMENKGRKQRLAHCVDKILEAQPKGRGYIVISRSHTSTSLDRNPRGQMRSFKVRSLHMCRHVGSWAGDIYELHFHLN